MTHIDMLMLVLWVFVWVLIGSIAGILVGKIFNRGLYEPNDRRTTTKQQSVHTGEDRRRGS